MNFTIFNQKLHSKTFWKGKKILNPNGIWTSELQICRKTFNTMRYADNFVKEILYTITLDFIAYFDKWILFHTTLKFYLVIFVKNIEWCEARIEHQNSKFHHF